MDPRREESDCGALAMSRALFAFLDRRDIEYAVIGDSADLASVVRSDIDIVVPPHELAGVPVLIDAFAREHGARLVQALRHEAVARYYVVAWRKDDGGIGFLHPDVCGDWWRGGRRLLSAEFLLEDRVRDPAGFARPSPPRNAIYYLLKRLDKGDLGPGHVAVIAREWSADRGAAARLAHRVGPPGLVEAVERALDSGDWTEMSRDCTRWRRALRASLPHPGRWLREFERRVERVLLPTGLLVEAEGIEAGAGDAFAARWSRAFRRTGRWHGGTGLRLRAELVRSTLLIGSTEEHPPIAARGVRLRIPATRWHEEADEIMLDYLSRRTRARLGIDRSASFSEALPEPRGIG
jgi:hypothetical protein